MLVSVSRRNGFLWILYAAGLKFQAKFAIAGRARQHARCARYLEVFAQPECECSQRENGIAFIS